MVCAVCKAKYNPQKPFIVCSGCKLLVHPKCIKLNGRDADKLNETGGLHWYCVKCRKMSPGVLLEQIKKFQLAFQSLHFEFNKVKAMVEQFESLTSIIGEPSRPSISNSEVPLLTSSLNSVTTGDEPEMNAVLGLTGRSLPGTPFPLTPDPGASKIDSNSFAALLNSDLQDTSKKLSNTEDTLKTSCSSSAISHDTESSKSPNENPNSPRARHQIPISPRAPRETPNSSRACQTPNIPPDPLQSSEIRETIANIAQDEPNANHIVLRAALLPKIFFISRLDPSTSLDEITAYVKAKAKKFSNSTLSFRVQHLNSHRSDRLVASFKLTVSPDLYDVISKPNFWPNDIIAHEFRPRKRKQLKVALNQGVPLPSIAQPVQKN